MASRSAMMPPQECISFLFSSIALIPAFLMWSAWESPAHPAEVCDIDSRDFEFLRFVITAAVGEICMR